MIQVKYRIALLERKEKPPWSSKIREIETIVSKEIQEELGWPNNHFNPNDAMRDVFDLRSPMCNSMALECVMTRLSMKYAIKLQDDDIQAFHQEMTYGEFIALVSYRAHGLRGQA